MVIIERANGKEHKVKIEPLADKDYGKITKSRCFFDWRTEKENQVFKITFEGSDGILGLISLIEHTDKRVQINLLAVSKENRGKKKIYEGIAGNLIAWACREAVKQFGEDACVSLISKTKLVKYYMKEYGMIKAGQSLFLSDEPLLIILEKYTV
jgi:hypothetical protein